MRGHGDRHVDGRLVAKYRRGARTVEVERRRQDPVVRPQSSRHFLAQFWRVDQMVVMRDGADRLDDRHLRVT